MVFRVHLFLSLCLIITACRNPESGKGIRNAEKKHLVRAEKSAPQITSLPFGPKDWPRSKDSNFYYTIIGKNVLADREHPDKIKFTPVYDLPEIKSIRYFDFDDELKSCDNGQPVDSLLRPAKYRIRFPDRGPYQCFYMADAFYDRSKDYSPAFINQCAGFVFDEYGYLIFYDPKTSSAIILDIFHTYYVDSVRMRIFYIDKDFTIHLIDESFTDGDEDGSSASDGRRKINVSISSKGQVKVTRLN